MNILYLSERDPRDTHFGGAQRTNYIWRALQQCGEVYSIFFDQQYETEEIAPRIWHGKKLLRLNAWQYFIYRAERKILKPFNVLPLWPEPTRLEKSIEDIFPDVKFDMVVCRYCFDLAEMHLWNFPKVYVDFDDHPVEMYETLGCKDVHPWLRPIGRWILTQQVRYIEKIITGGWISNPSQVSLFRTNSNITPLRNISKYPSKNYIENAPRKPLIVSVGVMSYYPNYQGVDRFLTEIWPAVHDKYPEIEFAIIGKGATDDYEAKWSIIPNVKVMGFVEDLEAMYQDCLCSVVSIYSGGGTCIKTLESLAHSRVCLATAFGARGLENECNNEDCGIFKYTTTDEFLALLEVQVLNSEYRIRNEENARFYIERNCSFHAFSNSLCNDLLSIKSKP